jgi:hypothetical protein
LLNGDAHHSVLRLRRELRMTVALDFQRQRTRAEYHKEPHNNGHFSQRLRIGVREGNAPLSTPAVGWRAVPRGRVYASGGTRTRPRRVCRGVNRRAALYVPLGKSQSVQVADRPAKMISGQPTTSIPRRSVSLRLAT